MSWSATLQRSTCASFSSGGDVEGFPAYGEGELGVFLVPDEDEVGLGGGARAIALVLGVRGGGPRLAMGLLVGVPHEELGRVRVRHHEVGLRFELANLVHLAGVDDLLPRLDEGRAGLLLEDHVLSGRHATLDDVHVGHHQSVWVGGAAVRLLGQVESLLVFELAALEDRAPSARKRGPHETVVTEPVVQKRHEGLPSRVVRVDAAGMRHAPLGQSPPARARARQ